jgi:hypothetical protein
MYELYTAVHNAGGYKPVVIDSDDLVTRPEATMASFCAAVDLPFIPEALTWAPGNRVEWKRSARWHVEASGSSGFTSSGRTYAHTVDNSDKLARFAAHHLPFYELLHSQRLRVGHLAHHRQAPLRSPCEPGQAIGDRRSRCGPAG